MELLTVNKCKEGDILAEDILNSFGVVIVAKNTVLNDYILYKLKGLGIEQIKIYKNNRKEESCTNSAKYMEVIKEYQENITAIKSIVNDLAAGKPLNVEKIINISNSVCSGLHDSHNILRVLNEAKDFDEYTYTHSLNVAFYAMLIGKWLGLNKEDIKIVTKAGLLHDIGKIKIPLEILNKNSKLSIDEFNVIKKHSIYGYDLTKEANSFSEAVCQAVLSHHERLDKSGYPYGAGGEEISIYSKIIAVADVFDAMTSDRIYKKKDTPFKVFEMFKTVGVKNFDPKVVNIFLNNVSVCYVGCKVLLNTGEIGEIAYIPPQRITEPVIRIDQKYIDLAQDNDRNIISMV